ncbi:hypothetical protein ACHAXT_001090 [Thalassiosira profunda]
MAPAHLLLLLLLALVGVAVVGDSEGGDGAVPTFTLANGITVPLVGLGSASGVAYPAVQSAIEAGYRFVDTAQSHSWGYREEDVGRAVREAGRRYEDTSDYVFVQTKIHPQDLGYQATKKAIQRSLDRQQATSLDSVLIHKPRCWEGICSREPEGTWHDSWRALEEAVDEGVVRSIGICDVDSSLFKELTRKRIPPTIVQNWFDPFHQDTRIRSTIARYNEEHPGKPILYQGYSTLGSQWHHFKGYKENPVMNDKALHSLAEKHGATVPQLVIQWAVRRGVMVLPASRSREHQEANLNSFFFSLSEEEMQSIDSLDGNPPPLPKKDPHEVQLKFVNRNEMAVNVFWVPEGGEESDHVHVGEMKGWGDTLQLTSYHGHQFLFREADGRKLNRHVVDRELGTDQSHEIQSEEL